MSGENLPALEDDLQEMSDSLSSLPSVKESPKTTLEVLNQPSLEDHWKLFLRYFLDPKEPHGLDSDLLEAVLNRFLSDEGIELDKFGLEEARVVSEAQTEDGNRADIIAYVEEDWFVWFELKVGSGERTNQTVNYVKDNRVADMSKEEFEQRFYIFVSKDGNKSRADEFVDVSWEDIAKVTEDVLANSDGRYTARGKAQLEDFRDTIRNVTGMSDTEDERVQEEKTKLYAEYYDEIAELENALDSVRDREVNRWHERFVGDYEPEGWDEDWNCYPSKYGRIYRDGWLLDEEGERTENYGEVNFGIFFQHFIWKPATFREGRFRFRTITPDRCPDEYRVEVKELFNKKYGNEVEEVMTGADKDIDYQKSGKRNRTNKEYKFDPTQGTDAFYETLREAFEDHRRLADIITEAHKTAVERVI